MKKISACVIAALALMTGNSVLAQTKPAAPAASAATAAPAAPAAPQSTPESEKAAKELLVAMKHREMMNAGFKQLSAQAPNVLLQATAGALGKNSKLTVDQKKAAMAKAEKDVGAAAPAIAALIADPKLADEIEKEISSLFAKNFKADELKQIIAFLATPGGGKFFMAFPQIMSQSSEMANGMVRARIEKQVEKFATDHAK